MGGGELFVQPERDTETETETDRQTDRQIINPGRQEKLGKGVRG